MTQQSTASETPARGQQGFTLIEIIAVLVILGILAAVAVPRFVDLQSEARIKGLESMVAAAQSQLSMEYANELLQTGNATAAFTNLTGDECDDVSVDGWLEDADLDCDPSDTHVSIIASYEGSTANGNFTNPNQ